MTQEQLHEADVVWPKTDHQGTIVANNLNASSIAVSSCKKSAPIDIPGRKVISLTRPEWVHHGFTRRGSRDDEEGFDEDDEVIVPPHVLVVGRASERMAFSMFTGNGRTLKGRDLRRFRNSVLQMTGFLEREIDTS